MIDCGWKELDEPVLAYAISIHKSQCSEYPALVVPYFNPALHHAAVESSLYCHNPGKETGSAGGQPQSHGYSHQK